MRNSHNFLNYLLLIPFSLSLIGNAQNVAINATGNQADPSAMLDVSSQTAGVLIPRMNTTSRNAISSPATGLQIYNTDCNELNFWNGTCWIAMGSLPDPHAITSNSATSLCGLVTAAYSIQAVTGATGYDWSVPGGATINSGQGTTSISVTWGNNPGEVCVKAYDACETSNETCLDIIISPIPATPGNITGLSSVNPGQTAVTYFIAAVPGASVYNWSVPSGATITAGLGTPAITVSFACNAVSGNISVTAGSNCGNSLPATLAVTVTPYLAANAGSAVFGGSAIGGSPTATQGLPPYNYSWSPNSNLSSPTVANPTALCIGSATTYTLTLTDAGGCSATSSVVVTRNLAANAGSNATICNGSSTPIGPATATGGKSSSYTYSWNPSTGLSSATIANPTANPTSNTTYTVTVSDANGCTATSSMALTVNSLPASTFSPTTALAGIAATFTPTVTGATYSWTFASASPASSTSQNPSVTWSNGGNYNVTLVVTQNGCSSTTTTSVTVQNPVQTFTYTGSMQTFTVPSGVTSVSIQAWGAQGANGGNTTTGIGGLGGYATGTLSGLSSGETLNIYVGGQGSGDNGGYNGGGSGANGNGGSYGYGGGGGGASDVRVNGTALGNRVIIAGGGGGGGGKESSSTDAGPGGVGGGSSGGTGSSSAGSGTGATGGGGGTSSGGGAGGTSDWCNGASGSSGTGGAGQNCNSYSGGGGGGGYYGGGSGANGDGGAGGGGGSGYIGGVSGGSMSNGGQSGNGQITITY